MGTDPQKLLEFVQDSGLSYKHNSRSFLFECPKCGGKNKLWMLKGSGYWRCWSCPGYRGKPEFFFSDALVVPVQLVREKLYGLQPVSTLDPIDLQFDDFFGPDDLELLDVETKPYPWHYFPVEHPLGKKGRDYLVGRGIPPELSQEYQLRYSPIEGRVVFPVHMENRLVGWQGRLVGPSRFWSEDDQKYVDIAKVLSSKDIPRDRSLMFSHRLDNSDHAVLCEGPIDALKCHYIGGNVAAMGKAVSRGQLALIRSRGIRKLFLGLDPDAFEETARLVRDTSDFETYIMDPTDRGYVGKDLGALGFAEVEDLFCSARRVGPGALFVFFG